MGQTSIFDYLYQEYKITKPIRLIEMFAGYGSQHLALKYLGLQVESHKIIEWAVPSIQAYKDLHFTNKNNDYTVNMTSDELLNKLLNYGISSNYNEPMTYEQIKRKGYEWQKQVYNNIKNTNNLVNIMNVKGEDLEINELDKYDYILTYSFPCQDLSLAGKRAGMDEDSETRSSLLWQVQRLLDELKDLNQLPQVLLMENVPQVIAQGNMQNMEKWDDFLSKLGYKSYIKNLIATDYGIPQIRNRTFMVSILGNYVYTFPKPRPLELKLSDMLEPNVDEKYYLSNKMIGAFSAHHDKYPRKERFIQALKNPNENDVANTITARAGQRPTDNFIIMPKKTKQYANYISWEDDKGRINTQDHRAFNKDVVGTIPAMERGVPKILVPEKTKKGYAEAEEGDGVYINRPHQKRGVVQKGKIQTIKTSCDDFGVVVGDNNIFNSLFAIFDLCCIIDTKEKDKYERSRELLQILWEEIGKKEIWQEIRRFISIQEKKILQSNLYENGLYKDRKPQSKISTSTPNSSEYNESITNREKMFDMWKNWKTRYTPQRWELSEQQFRQFNLFMQELSYETTQGETSMQDMWQTNERFRILQQTLFKIQEIWRPNENKISNGLRIRKLTPREVFRLMGVKDEDFDKIKDNQSNSSLYHLAGDSIVVNVLMAIFKQIL